MDGAQESAKERVVDKKLRRVYDKKEGSGQVWY